MYIIEFNKLYWSGATWGSKKNAKQFESPKQAWVYVELSGEDTEDFSLEKV